MASTSAKCLPQVPGTFRSLPCPARSARKIKHGLSSRAGIATMANFRVPNVDNEPNVRVSRSVLICPTNSRVENICQRIGGKARSFGCIQQIQVTRSTSSDSLDRWKSRQYPRQSHSLHELTLRRSRAKAHNPSPIPRTTRLL